MEHGQKEAIQRGVRTRSITTTVDNVDVTAYDAEKNGDLVLFAYRGLRNGEFDGGPENTKPQVTIIGSEADVVYDDDGKQGKWTNFR